MAQVNKPANPSAGILTETMISQSILGLFSLAERKRILDLFVSVKVKAGQKVTRQGKPADKVFLLVSGKLIRKAKNPETGTTEDLEPIVKNRTIDLEAVINQGPWPATTIAAEDSVVVALWAKDFLEILAGNKTLHIYLDRVINSEGARKFKNTALENGVSRNSVIRLITEAQLLTLGEGQALFQKGGIANSALVINKGSILLTETGEGESTHQVAEMRAGAFLNSSSALKEEPLKFSAVSREAGTEVLSIPIPVLRSVIEIDPAFGEWLGIVREKTVIQRRNDFYSQITRDPPTIELEDDDDRASPFIKREKMPELAPAPQAPKGFRKYALSQTEQAPGDDFEKPPIELFLKGESKRGGRAKTFFKFVRQHDEMDCSAACLSMIARIYGKNISLPAYRTLIHVTKEGASMWSLIRAATQTGFQALGCQTSWDRLMEARLPAIILMHYHFVVVYRINRTHAWIADPALGKIKVPRAEIEKRWKGMALLFRPTPAFYKQPESVPTFRKYLLLLHSNRRLLAEVFAASLLIFIFGLFGPIFTQVTFDQVLVKKDTSMVNLLVMAMAAVAVLQIATNAVQTYLVGHLSNRFDIVFSSLFYRHMMRLPFGYFSVRKTGDLLTRFAGIEQIRKFMTGDTMTTAISVISIFLYGFVVYLYSPKLVMLVFIAVPLIFISTVALSGRLSRGYISYFQENARANSLVVEQFRALETVKSLAGEIPARWRWEEAHRRSLARRFDLAKLGIGISAISSSVEQLTTTAFFYVAAKMTISGELSIGQVIAVTQFISSTLSPARALAQQWNSIQQTKVAFSTVDDLITAQPEEANDPGYAGEGMESALGRRSRIRGELEFKNVWFQYGSDASPWVLKGLNIQIPQGQTVAIVGRSGSGKTTLASLINLLHQPTRGQILIDRVDSKQYPLNRLRQSVGVVMQESHLFAGTVLENITYGDDMPDIDRAMEAAKAANAHDFILSLPGGYAHVLQESGSGLSGGQRQRINIARALYKNPPILIMDEATSALDSESEMAVVEAMKTVAQGRTTLIIAHRLSTVIGADRIIVMERGQIAEEGTHQELFRQGELYRKIFGKQMEQGALPA